MPSIPYDILKALPPEREQALRSIERFSMFEVFLYRSSLWHHELRVFLLLDALAPLVRQTIPHCDMQKAGVMALVHDDAEIITGDVQLGHKETMSADQLKKVEDDEAAAIEQLAKLYPKTVGDYPYRDLLLHVLRKDSIEAQVLSYADKLDAYCESLHELFGGNLSALRSVLGYEVRLLHFSEKFPNLAPLLSIEDSPLTNVRLRTNMMRVFRKDYEHFNTPHTPASIQLDTDIPIYTLWRKLVLDGLGEEGLRILTTQKERL